MTPLGFAVSPLKDKGDKRRELLINMNVSKGLEVMNL